MKVLISIPAYNEENDIERVIKEIKEVMDNKYNYSIQVIDDGSTDKTVEVAKKLGAKVYTHPRNLGLAEAFKTELQKFLESKADIMVHIDADGQYPAEYIPQLIEKIKSGNDLVIGSRVIKERKDLSRIKKWGNKAFSRVVSKIIRFKITDAQSGFRAFTKNVARIKIRSAHTYTQEQIIRVARNKFKITEVPVRTRPTRRSKLLKNPFEYAIKSWINLFRIYRDYEPLKFFGLIGLSFLIVGFIFGIYLLARFLIVGNIGHLPLAILTMLLVTIGVQIILFGFLADMRKE